MPNHSQLDAVVRRFPGPVRLTQSRGKWVLVLLASIGFTAVGAVMIRAGDASGWLTSLFALGIPISAIMLLPGAGGLVLDGEGFNVTSLYRSHRARWKDVDGFVVARLPQGTKMVVYDSRALKPGALAKVSTRISGRNSGLPETYGLKPEALAELMVRWREQALRSDAT